MVIWAVLLEQPINNRNTYPFACGIAGVQIKPVMNPPIKPGNTGLLCRLSKRLDLPIGDTEFQEGCIGKREAVAEKSCHHFCSSS